MRLIDANELKPSLIAELVCDDGEDEEDIIAYKIETIENAPTVKAIPIEWLEQLLDDAELAGQPYTINILKRILSRWEKENETN